MSVIPLAVIATLLMSLWESIFVLPCHLSHEHHGFFRIIKAFTYPLWPIGRFLEWLSEYTSSLFDGIADRIYVPALRFCLRHPVIPVAILLSMMIVTIGAIRGGVVPLVPFPKLDSKLIVAKISFPDGTPMPVTDRATRVLEETVREVNRDIALERAARENRTVEEIYPKTGLDFRGPVELTFRQVGEITSAGGPASEQGASGSHAGQVLVQLHDTTIREISSQELINRWRRKAGEFFGVESLSFGSVEVGPGGRPIEFKLLAPAADTASLQAATELAKTTLKDFTGVFDVADDNAPGKWEFQFNIRDDAMATGVTPADLGEVVRNAFFGAEVTRLQRGRHEVKLMVRYPKNERHSLADFTNMQIRTADGAMRPINELAETKVIRGFSEINRVDQERSITITADVDEAVNNASQIISDLKEKLVPLINERYPNVSLLWEGQQQQTRESLGSLQVGFTFAMLAMFVLLVLQFQSYFQPLLILAAIPFGMIGAVWGHVLMGLPLTLFSMFGLVALAGVVVNDSIVLVDFINARVRAGEPLRIVLQESGRRRFRPVLLTSLTTIAGLAPLLAERSFQAQLLIPMATSLAFGLIASTMLVLFMVPMFYLFYVRANEWMFGEGAMVQEVEGNHNPIT